MSKSMAKWAVTELRKRSMKCVMVTLTFDGSPREWTGKECQIALNNFFRRFKREYWVRDYLVCRELQERGVYHYHVAVLGVDFLPFDEIEAMWGCGFVWLTAFDNPGNAMKYLLKYVNKGGRFHASLHLLDSLDIRVTVRAMRQFFSTVWRLGNALRCGVVDLLEYRSMYDDYVVGC